MDTVYLSSDNMKLEFPATVREGYRITIPSNHRKLSNIKIGATVMVTIEITDHHRRTVIA